MKYLIYCRKSTDTEDRQVLSLESQETELQRLAEAQGLKVAGVLRESMSAKAVGRPVFNQLLKAVSSGKADGILCWKLDRLARNMVDGGQVMDLLQRGVIKEIRTYESIHLSSDNVLMLAVHFGMANQYIRDLSINVKRGLRAKLERGDWPNKPPLGYFNDKNTKQIIIDPISSKYVVRAFELYATGSYGIEGLADKLYAEGLRSTTGTKIPKSTLHKVLLRSFYTGVMEREGRFTKAITLLSFPSNFMTKPNSYSQAMHIPNLNALPPSRGFLKCASCGCALTASLKKGHQYYYCTNGKGKCNEHKSYLRENTINGMVADLFDSLHFSERKIELMYKAAEEKSEQEGGQEKQNLNRLQTLLNALLEKESRLLDTFVAGQIPKELYDRKVGEIQHERLDLTRQIREAENKGSVSTLEPTKQVFLQASKAKKEFLDGDDTKKRTIVENLLWNLSIENKSVAQIQYKSPFHLLANTPKNASLSTMLAS